MEVTREGVRWLGDRRIAEDLTRLYEQWCSLGRPALDDYEVTFHRHGDSSGKLPRNNVFHLDRPALPTARRGPGTLMLDANVRAT